jgi:hypothetical protein
MSFLLAGLVGASEQQKEDGSRVLCATNKNVVSNGAPLKKVALMNSVDNGLIDEDGLLDEDAHGLLAPPLAMSEAAASANDCGGRKACDSCTCGRKEQEAGMAPTKQIMIAEVARRVMIAPVDEKSKKREWRPLNKSRRVHVEIVPRATPFDVPPIPPWESPLSS